MNKINWIIGVLLLSLLVWGGTKYFATQKVEQLIEQANQNGNQLTIADWSLSFNFLGIGLNADSIALEQTVGNQLVKGNISRLSLEGLGIKSLLFDDYPQAGRLLVTEPDLTIVSKPSADTANTGSTKKKGSIFKLAEAKVVGGQIIRRPAAGGEATQHIYGLSVNSQNLVIPDFLSGIEAYTVSVDSIHFSQPASPAEWWLRDVQIIDTSGVSVGKITLEPKQSQRAFLRDLETKKSWNALAINGFQTAPFPLTQLLSDTVQTNIAEISAESFDFIVYESPALPRPPNEEKKKMPVEQLREVPLNIMVDKISLPSVKITYGVLDIDGKEHGLPFSGGSVQISNLSTSKEERPLVIDGDFTFDSQAPLKLKFELNQSGSGRDFLMSGTLGAYDMVNINPLMRIAADAIIETGQLHEISYDGRVENDVAQGNLMFKYSDLNLKLTGGGSFFKNLLSGIAIKSHNPQKDGDLREGTIYHEHDAKRPFFNLYWKAIVSGLKSTTVGNLFIPNELAAEKVKD